MSVRARNTFTSILLTMMLAALVGAAPRSNLSPAEIPTLVERLGKSKEYLEADTALNELSQIEGGKVVIIKLMCDDNLQARLRSTSWMCANWKLPLAKISDPAVKD